MKSFFVTYVANGDFSTSPTIGGAKDAELSSLGAANHTSKTFALTIVRRAMHNFRSWLDQPYQRELLRRCPWPAVDRNEVRGTYEVSTVLAHQSAQMFAWSTPTSPMSSQS